MDLSERDLYAGRFGLDTFLFFIVFERYYKYLGITERKWRQRFREIFYSKLFWKGGES
jgi:hypothetical protein